MQVTYEGETLQQLEGQLEYVNNQLKKPLEQWQLEEWGATKALIETGIESIKERTKQLKK